ncbi:MAG: CehA/McbA family metallohydrolase [Bryobacteraceae bacterium]
MAAVAVLWFTGSGAQQGPVEALEIAADNASLLPSGKEADGIIGDFVLRNEALHVLVAGNQPMRRANMGTEYGFPTPGALYDFDLRGQGNDQLTVLRPGQLGGPLSWVRVAKDGRDGEGVIESVRTAAAGNGLEVRHEYRLKNGWRHLMITSTYRNRSAGAKDITPQPAWKEFSRRWQVGEVRIGDSIDPFDKRAYAWAPVGPVPEKASLAAGEEKSYSIIVAAGSSPLAAYGEAIAANARTGGVEGSAKSGSAGAIHASLLFEIAGQTLPLYPDSKGEFALRLPPASYKVRFSDLGRDDIEKQLTVAEGKTARLDISVPAASAVRFDLRDEQGRPSPCKVQFLGRNGTQTPDLGTYYRAHGGDHQYQSHDGQFTQQLPPGSYLVRITRGPEFDLEEREIEVAKGSEVAVSAVLKHTVDTKGWVSTDYHAHSTPSGDNYCSTRDRIINFAAEHIEFAPTTEHNRIYDWASQIDQLGLGGKLKTIIGMELTGRGQHFNAFPLPRIPLVQDGGAPQWNRDPRITAITLRDFGGSDPSRWVQANHPLVSQVFNDRDGDGVEDGGFSFFERMIDAAEVWSTEILNNQTSFKYKRQDGKESVGENRTFGWLQMLNQGRHAWCVAVSDAHQIFGNGVGSWRTYVPSSTDDPASIRHEEIIRNSKAGRMMVTNGPFLEVSTADGQPIGSSVISPGGVSLRIKVQTANWMDIDRVQILVNGRQPSEYNFTRQTHPAMFRDGRVKFDETVAVKLQRDAHLIVVATGEKSMLEKGWGRSWESSMHPMAYTNPIYVDVDGKGFQPNGDTLGHPILTVVKGAGEI